MAHREERETPALLVLVEVVGLVRLDLVEVEVLALGLLGVEADQTVIPHTSQEVGGTLSGGDPLASRKLEPGMAALDEGCARVLVGAVHLLELVLPRRGRARPVLRGARTHGRSILTRK